MKNDLSTSNEIFIWAQSLDNQGDASDCVHYIFEPTGSMEKRAPKNGTSVFGQAMEIKKAKSAVWSDTQETTELSLHVYRNQYLLTLDTGDRDNTGTKHSPGRISRVLCVGTLPLWNDSNEEAYWISTNLAAIRDFCQITERVLFDEKSVEILLAQAVFTLKKNQFPVLLTGLILLGLSLTAVVAMILKK